MLGDDRGVETFKILGISYTDVAVTPIRKTNYPPSALEFDRIFPSRSLENRRVSLDPRLRT